MKIEGNLTHNENEMGRKQRRDENNGEKKMWVQNNCEQKIILNTAPRICRKQRQTRMRTVMKEMIHNATDKDEYESNYTQ